jgi:hypothetical protein
MLVRASNPCGFRRITGARPAFASNRAGRRVLSNFMNGWKTLPTRIETLILVRVHHGCFLVG